MGSFGGVLGGVGGRCDACCDSCCGLASHRITLEACLARWDIISLLTGITMNCASAALLDMVEEDMIFFCLLFSGLADLIYGMSRLGILGEFKVLSVVKYPDLECAKRNEEKDQRYQTDDVYSKEGIVFN